MMALDRLFKPLARLAIAKELRFADVAERLRRAYVDVALEIAGPNATVSRVSVMTGLQRRDVSRLIESREAPMESRPDAYSRIVAIWLSEFDGASLPQHGPEGSFDAIARQVRRDIHPKTLLDALIAAGTAGASDGQVNLLRSAHVPLQGSDAQIDYLGKNVGDHLTVAVDNVLGTRPSFDLAVHYSDLSPQAAVELETMWRERMTTVLQDLNARASELQSQEDGPVRIRGGGYFRVETEE